MTAPRILLLNPNSSASVTTMLEAFARRHLGTRALITALTAPFGPPALATEADVAVAARAVEAMVRDAPGHDVAIIAAFGDPGLDTVREMSAMPVLGIGEEGMRTAAEGGRRFAVVTLGPAMREAIERKAAGLRLDWAMTGICFVEAGVLDIAADPAAFHDTLVWTARVAAERGAEAILFGGAPFAGIAGGIADRVPVPVVDGVTAALDAALQRCVVSQSGAR